MDFKVILLLVSALVLLVAYGSFKYYEMKYEGLMEHDKPFNKEDN